MPSAYEIYASWSEEQKKLYHKKWVEYVESHHDENLELSHRIEIDYREDDCGFQMLSDKDFTLEYKNNPDEMIQLFSHRKCLKYLFENGFKLIQIDRTRKLHQYLNNITEHEILGKKYPVCHRCMRSPEINIVSGKRQSLALFIEGNDLYAYVGSGSMSNGMNEEYFCYVGTIKY